jgi:hypothetical protein
MSACGVLLLSASQAAIKPSSSFPDCAALLPTAHCTLHTAHCTLHTAHCTLHTAHCTLHTAHCTLHTAHCPGDLVPSFPLPAALQLDFPLGGSQAMVAALVRGLEKRGGRLLTGAHVERVMLEGGRAAGVALRGGGVIKARWGHCCTSQVLSQASYRIRHSGLLTHMRGSDIRLCCRPPAARQW